QDADGAVIDATCPAEVGPAVGRSEGEWVCTHAWPAVAGMVGFHDATHGEPVTDWWDDTRQIAFGRGDAGFVVVNKAEEPREGTWSTSLAPGTYCDVAAGPMVDGACAGGDGRGRRRRDGHRHGRPRLRPRDPRPRARPPLTPAPHAPPHFHRTLEHSAVSPHFGTLRGVTALWNIPSA